MVSGPPGFALALVVCGAGALLALIVVRLWPRSSDTPQRLAARLLRAWNKLSGIDDKNDGHVRRTT